jgi:hypothetical protein
MPLLTSACTDTRRTVSELYGRIVHHIGTLGMLEDKMGRLSADDVFYPATTSWTDTVAGDGIHVIGPRRYPTDDDAIGVLQSLRKSGAGADGRRNLLVVSTDCTLRGSRAWIAFVDIDGITTLIGTRPGQNISFGRLSLPG